MRSSIRLLTFTLSLFLIVVSIPFFPSYAAENTVTYENTELSMTIDIPSDTAMIERTVRKNDELFKNGTFEYITAMTQMRNDGAVLYGKSLDGAYEFEIIGSANEGKVKNLSKLSDRKQDKLLEIYKQQPDIVECSRYSGKNADFFFSLRTLNNADGRFFYGDYYTVFNGQDITVRLISENDKLTDSELNILKNMADSVRFPQKQKLTFSSIQGKGVFVTFIVLFSLFILIILYRRNDESVNRFIIAKIAEYKAASENKDSARKIVKDEDQQSSEAENTHSEEKVSSDNTDSNNDNNSSENNTDDEEDLSSIDLDEAIAAFDDSLK